MNKKLTIFLTIFLLGAASATLWSQYFLEQDAVEISEKFEKDAEENEKELENLTDGDDHAGIPSAHSSLAWLDHHYKLVHISRKVCTTNEERLFILYRRLKISC